MRNTAGKRTRAARTVALGALIILGAFAAAETNVARIHSDASFTGNLSADSSDPLVLRAETMQVVLPALTTAQISPKDRADVTVNYFLEARVPSTFATGLRFLAVGMTDCWIAVNGEPVATRESKDGLEERTFLRKLTQHRFEWMRERYDYFFSRLVAAGGGRGYSGHEDLTLFLRAAESLDDLGQVIDRPAAFTIVSFSARLRPGPNTISVRFRQGLYVDGRTTYFGGPVVITGFDYLLYPARTWRLDPAFELAVAVSLPDIREKGWFFDTWHTPEYESNLSFSSSYDPPKHLTVLDARLRGFPVDVFTFMFHCVQKR